MSEARLPETTPAAAWYDTWSSRLPTQDELPCDDGEPMETQRHKWQMDLLIDVTEVWLRQRPDGYANGNMFIYFSPEQLKGKHFRGPDFFAVLGVPKGERKSWVVWHEHKGPDVIIELLSDSTARYDKKRKKAIYQDPLKVPEYFWLDPFELSDLAGFRLNQEGIYEPILPDARGRLISRQLDLALRLWPGVYRGIEGTWLRWETLDGKLLPTDAEAERQHAEQEKQRAEQEKQRAEQEKQRAEQAEARLEALQARLRTLGIDPDA